VTRCLFLATVLTVAGCTGPAPAKQTYLLLPGPAPLAADSAEVVRLVLVEVAPYLDREGIVLLREPAEMHVAGQHVWAEPLEASISRYLQVAIGRASGRVVEVPPFATDPASRTLEVRIQQLHGSLDGQVRLVAEYRIGTPAGARLHRFEAGETQRGDGYGALVDAHAALLDSLAEAIAATLDG
jgi:uncharacterized lipoprotein YmbA